MKTLKKLPGLVIKGAKDDSGTFREYILLFEFIPDKFRKEWKRLILPFLLLGGLAFWAAAAGGQDTKICDLTNETTLVGTDEFVTAQCGVGNERISASEVATYMAGAITMAGDVTGTPGANTLGTLDHQLFVDGGADEVQLRVQGNATQTSDILLVETSAAVPLIDVNGDGDMTFGGSATQNVFVELGEGATSNFTVSHSGANDDLVVQMSGVNANINTASGLTNGLSITTSAGSITLNPTASLILTDLTDCDTMDTNGSGVVSCGTDDDVPESGDFGAAADLDSTGDISAAAVGRNEIDEALLSVQTHATDCTLLTCDAGSDGEPCFEQDDNYWWTCDGSGTPAWTRPPGPGVNSFDITDTDASPILTVDDGEQIQFIGAGTVTVAAAADGSNHDVTITGSAHTADQVGTVNDGDFCQGGAASVLDCDVGQASIPGTDHIDAIAEIATALKSGVDTTLITGTEGTSGNCSEWNADGDLVDAGGACLTDAASATPGIDFDDSDTTVETIDAQISVNATDAGTGTEDVDFWVGVQVNSTLTTRFTIDADGQTQINAAALEVDATDPADSGAVRLDNNEGLCWEASPTGTDVCIVADANEIVAVTGGVLDANTGDSATAFFDDGTIEHERGGMEADVSAYSDGLFGMNAGVTTDIDTISEFDTALGLTGTPDATTYLRGDGSWSAPGGSGDVTAVGPGCADGECLTDGKATTGSVLGVWEGTTVNANDLTFNVPADPAGANSVTFPDAVTATAQAVTCSGTDKVSAFNATTGAFTCTTDQDSGGTPAWEALVNTADTATSYTSNNTAETVTFSFESAFGASQQLLIRQQTGNPTAGTLLDVRAADTDVTVFRAGDGSNGVTVSQAGAMTAEGSGSIVATDLQTASSVVSDAEVDNDITLTNITQITNRAAENLSSSCTDVQVLGGTGASGVECQTDDDVPEAADYSNLTGGAGIVNSPTGTIATASGETDFLTSGALTCGAGTQGRAQTHTTPLQYCDNTATPVLRYAAYGDSAGAATSVADGTVDLGGTGGDGDTSGDLDPDRIAGDSSDDNLLDAAAIADAYLLIAGDSSSGAYTLTGDWDFGGGGIEIENGTTPPACTSGQLFYDTDATSGQRLMACEGGTFVTQGDGTGSGYFSKTGTAVHPTTNGDEFVIGASAELQESAVDAKVSIDSSDADQPVLMVQGYSTQTNSLLILEQSDGTNVMTVSNAGSMTLGTSGADGLIQAPASQNLDIDANGQSVTIGDGGTNGVSIDDSGDFTWLGTGTFVLPGTADPTTDGMIAWDTTNEQIEVGDDGAATDIFRPANTFTDTQICVADTTANEIDCNVASSGTGNVARVDSPTFTTAITVPADSIDTGELNDASDTPVEGEVVAISATTTAVNYVPPAAICKTLFDSGNLAATDDVTSIYRWASPAIITEAWCEVGDGTNVQIDLVTSDGADNITTDCVCTTGGVSCTLTDTTMIDGELVDLTIDSISGSVTRLTFCLEWRYDL